jgi:hypothetical protein
MLVTLGYSYTLPLLYIGVGRTWQSEPKGTADGASDIHSRAPKRNWKAKCNFQRRVTEYGTLTQIPTKAVLNCTARTSPIYNARK